MRILLLFAGAVVALTAYEFLVYFANRPMSMTDDARQMRIRQLSRQGQLPGEVHY